MDIAYQPTQANAPGRLPWAGTLTRFPQAGQGRDRPGTAHAVVFEPGRTRPLS
jgi:hypothetical protein